MSDTITPLSASASDNSQISTQLVKKSGSGKLLASIISAGIAVHLASYVKSHYNVVLSDEEMNLLEMSSVGFFVWLTPQNVIATVKDLISDWKDIVKTWNSP